MGEIIDMLVQKVVDRSPRAILEAAINENLENVIILGETKDGSVHFSMSPMDCPEILFLLEVARHTIMDEALRPEEDG